MTSLFTTTQLTELVEDRRKIRAKKLAEQFEPFVNEAVKFYADQMRPASQRILDDLKYTNWSRAFDFHSYDFANIPGQGNWYMPPDKWVRVFHTHYSKSYMLDPPGTMIVINHECASMWSIWRHTDFRKRLLDELGLDANNFEFKIVTTNAENGKLFNDPVIPEYRNRVYLAYRQRPKKTFTKYDLDPCSDK
jgi:hypothetical protein